MNAVAKFPEPVSDIFGAARDPSYPCPHDLLHVSLAHAGPGVEELQHWYGVVLNMRFVYKVVYPTFEFIALSYDDENHRIGIVNSTVDGGDGFAAAQAVVHDHNADKLNESAAEPRHEPLRKCRVEHTSWEYKSFEDVLAVARKVHDELGIWPRTARHAGGGITIDYADPDGNRVELLSKRSSKAQDLWRLHKLVGHKHGVDVRDYTDTYKPFNMAKMIELWEQGYPVEQLRDREHCMDLQKEGKL